MDKWFKSSTKIKRWIFLIIIGIVLCCYGIAKILVTDEIGFKALIKIVMSFVVGFTFIVTGIISIQRRTLELLVQESDTRSLEKGNNVNSLIFNKKVYNQGPKIVVIGGGSGLNTVLKGLKNYTDNITAIVTVSDYGDLKDDPLNNIKDSIVALSNEEKDMENLLNTEISIGKNQVKFSDIYFNVMQQNLGNFAKSIEKSKNVLNMTGKVLPVTLDAIKICAELEDGTVIENKDKIPEIVNEKISKINRVYLSPTNCMPAPGVLEAIDQADAIVIGPGSLYTNVIPNLLVPGVSKEIKESKAFKIYVSNIMTEFGQTDNFSLSDHIQAILDHAGRNIIEYCIYDTGEIVPEYIRKYNKEGSELVEQDVQNVKELGIKLIQRNLSKIEDESIRHNPEAIATSIVQLICDDLKFNDMQNNAQFLMLDSKIKDTNTKLKNELKKKKEQKNKNKTKGKTSKFFTKYNERIENIRQSEIAPKKEKGNIKPLYLEVEDEIEIKNTEPVNEIINDIEEEAKEEKLIIKKEIKSDKKINHKEVHKSKHLKQDNKNSKATSKKETKKKKENIVEDQEFRDILDKIRK